jgi:hypothetical protein
MKTATGGDVTQIKLQIAIGLHSCTAEQQNEIIDNS